MIKIFKTRYFANSCPRIEYCDTFDVALIGQVFLLWRFGIVPYSHGMPSKRIVLSDLASDLCGNWTVSIVNQEI